MGLDFPRVDTADVGRLLLRLRDELEATNEALKNGSEDEKKAMVEKCSNFLLNESEKMVKLQDSGIFIVNGLIIRADCMFSSRVIRVVSAVASYSYYRAQ